MGRRKKNKKEKEKVSIRHRSSTCRLLQMNLPNVLVAIQVVHIPHPDRTKPLRDPLVIPKKLFEVISDFMLQTSAPIRNVFLTASEYTMEFINPRYVQTVEGPTHLIVFCLRLINDQFNPIAAVQIDKRVDQAKKLAIVWKAILQDLGLLRLIVIGSLSPATSTFHNVLSVLTENPKLNEHTGPITYSVWPYKEILHLYDYSDMAANLQDAFYERVNIHFLTRPPSSETASNSVLNLYLASWTDILLTITSAGIKCSYTDEEEAAIEDLSISSSSFKKAFKKVTRKGLIGTDTQPSTNRLLNLLWSVNAFFADDTMIISPDELEVYYNENEDFRIFLATARFCWLGPSDFWERESSTETTGSSIELLDDQLKNIIALIDSSLMPRTPFDAFLQMIVYDDQELYHKTSLAEVLERKTTPGQAELVVPHDHRYYKNSDFSCPKTEGTSDSAKPISRIANLVKEYFEENFKSHQALPTELASKHKPDSSTVTSNTNKETGKDKLQFSKQNPHLVSNMHNCYGKPSNTEIRQFKKETHLLVNQEADSAKVPKKSDPKTRKKIQRGSKFKKKETKAPPDDFMLFPYDTPKFLKHSVENCDDSKCKFKPSAAIGVNDQNNQTCDHTRQCPETNTFSERATEKLTESGNNGEDRDINDNISPQKSLSTRQHNSADVFQTDKSYNRTIDCLDLAASSSDAFGSLTQIIMDSAIRDFSNILVAYENTFNKPVESNSEDSLAELFSTFDKEDEHTKIPSKFLVPKTTSGQNKSNLPMTSFTELQSSYSDSELLIKGGLEDVDLLKLQNGCKEKVGLPSKLPLQELATLTKSIKNSESSSEQAKLLDKENLNGEIKSEESPINESSLTPCCCLPSTLAVSHDSCGAKSDTNTKSTSTSKQCPADNNNQKTDDEVTEIDYREYKNKLISSTFCDKNNPNCDTIFTDRHKFNELFNSMPKDTETMRITTDWLCTFKGYIKLKEILEKRNVKCLASTALSVEHADFYIALVRKLKNNILSTVYQGSSYRLIDFNYLFDVINADKYLYALTPGEEEKRS